MALRARIINGLSALNSFLRGGIVGGKDLRKATFNINGKTLVFSMPAGTVTFVTPDPTSQEPLGLRAILTQINAVPTLAGFAHTQDGLLIIENPAGGTSVVLSNTGTANALLGFDPDGATGIAYNAPGGASPCLVSVDTLSIPGAGNLVITDE